MCRVILYRETAKFVPDGSELILFVQLQLAIRNKTPSTVYYSYSVSYRFNIYWQGNEEIDQLSMGNVLEASKFHEKHHVNNKGLTFFSMTWQQAKEIIRKCPPYSLYNQASSPARNSPKSAKRNEIWQRGDVLRFCRIWKTEIYTPFHWYIFRSNGQLLWALKKLVLNDTYIGNKFWGYLHKLILIMPSPMSQ